MSSSDASLTEAQWDLLADYLGGALDGGPQYDEVTGLIESDPEWREAHTLLAAADDAVRDDLRLLAEAPVGPMPDDVATRLAAAFATDNVIPLRRRRVARWALPATIAAGVLAFASIGLTGLLGGAGSSEDATSAAGSAPEAAVPPALAQQVMVSGRDYTAATAQALATRAETEQFASPLSASGQDAPAGRDLRTPPLLQRLIDPAALNHCLGAIAIEHGVASMAVRLIDYASFEGSPGLLVVFTDPTGGDMVWVVGPDCGVEGTLADTRYHAPVG
ncbi:hypothetical protein ACIA8K_15255 [Catenuloplanes sp. NPDC051500]|uniref:hypothetical protein n=1 Tax=Catenuloplanes sp. NPDC051500 TaxID=3363959 RepID=UPI00379C99E9